MYRIYFENRVIIVCPECEHQTEDANSVIFFAKEDEDFINIIELFDTDTNLNRIYIPSGNPEKTFGRICSCFSEINAGGGLVTNRRGDYLMICRNGLWDLPKGKQEKDEEITVTALREVREETGLAEIEQDSLICVTHHCYRWQGKGDLILKHTYWYSMEYTAPIELIPQTEEDITKATWIAKSSLPAFLDNTYPSIVEVFHEAKVI